MAEQQTAKPFTPPTTRRGFLEHLSSLVGGSTVLAAAGAFFGIQRGAAAPRRETAASAVTAADPGPYIGEIRMIAFNFAPVGWAKCDGQVLSIQSNTPLFSLIGTYYGGNGVSTFALPDLRGRVPLHVGDSNGLGLSSYGIGEMGGEEQHLLSLTELPSHNHGVLASSATGNSNSPSGLLPAPNAEGIQSFGNSSTVAMAGSMVQSTGGSTSHENRQPYTGITFIICTDGVFPSRP